VVAMRLALPQVKAPTQEAIASFYQPQEHCRM
jgi:hypothetical protein